MEQNNKLETIFTEGSLTDQQNALETSLLRGGSASIGKECDSGIECIVGSEERCASEKCCLVGELPLD